MTEHGDMEPKVLWCGYIHQVFIASIVQLSLYDLFSLWMWDQMFQALLCRSILRLDNMQRLILASEMC